MIVCGFSVPRGTKVRNVTDPFGHVLGRCTSCEMPSVFTFDPEGTADWDGVGMILSHAMSNNTSNLSAGDYSITLFEQRSLDSEVPAHLPEDVTKALLQAETNFEVPDHEEAAATMYRRALERAIKFAHPDLQGTLAGKIKSLTGQGTIPKALGDWADQVRLIGNDGAHDDGVSRDDLLAARAFCDNFLRYLITLPKQVELRKAQSS